DDLLPTLSAEFKEKVNKFVEKLYAAMDEVTKKLVKEVEELKKNNPSLTKKQYAVSVTGPNKKPSTADTLKLKLFDESNPQKQLKTVIDLVKRNCTVKNFEITRSSLGLSNLNFFT